MRANRPQAASYEGIPALCLFVGARLRANRPQAASYEGIPALCLFVGARLRAIRPQAAPCIRAGGFQAANLISLVFPGIKAVVFALLKESI